MKKSIILVLILLIASCNNDDNNPEIKMEQKEMEEVPGSIPSNGVFLDAPVQGLTYSYSDVTGETDAEGTFKYIEGESVTFKIGDIILGELQGRAIITPLDFLENGTINTQEVRNIASLLQSLDNDGDTANGILIDDNTKTAMAGELLDFNSDNFSIELKALLIRINATNASSLVHIHSNEAAKHLAESLNIQSEFQFLPRVIQGREWEEGEYFNLNAQFNEDEYVFKIGNDLNGVRYSFGQGTGFYLNMTYEPGKLSGFGNLYTDLDAEIPSQPNLTYEYRNRVMSPGYVMDYNGETFLGYYNYFKISGDLGKIEGTYESFFYYENKKFDEAEEFQFVFKKHVIIDEADSDGNFGATIIDFNVDDIITNTSEIIIDKEDVNDENILLIRFQGTDYIFIDPDTSLKYFSPGLLTIKK